VCTNTYLTTRKHSQW
jgi:chromobox protein 1